MSDHDSGNGFAGRQGGALHLPMTDGVGSVGPWKCAPRSHRGSRFDKGKTAAHQLFRMQDGVRVHGNHVGRDDGGRACNKGGQEFRNKRSVWTVSTEGYRDAHFAVFPPELIRPCILAGCPQGGLVLDPFGGSGTTAMVCKDRGRKCISIELNKEYAALHKKRLAQEVLPLE